MNKKLITVIAGASLTAGMLGLGISGAYAGDRTGTSGTTGAVTAAPKPPKGARAVVQVSPNPTTERGQEITITGNCGGGKGLKGVFGGVDQKRPTLRNVRIIKDDPDGFVAKAKLSREIGNGVGPVFVDCGGEAGVTLLVTHV